jgi:hypothetical protein
MRRLVLFIAISIGIIVLVGCGGTALKPEKLPSEGNVGSSPEKVSLNKELVEQAKKLVSAEPLSFKDENDIASIAMGAVQHLIDIHPDFNKHLAGSIPLRPLKVVSYDSKMKDYFIVPFGKDNMVLGAAEIIVIDNAAKLSSAYYFPSPRMSVFKVGPQEAKEILIQTKGNMDLPTPRLVYQKSELALGTGSPFWEFKLSETSKLFVNQDGKVYDTILPQAKGLAGGN